MEKEGITDRIGVSFRNTFGEETQPLMQRSDLERRLGIPAFVQEFGRNQVQKKISVYLLPPAPWP